MSQKRQAFLFKIRRPAAVELTTLSHDYGEGHLVGEHFHLEDQLLFATTGAMTVRTPETTWVVPPLRAVWIPRKEVHSILMSSAVPMRTLYFAPRLTRALPRKCFVLNVSPLCRELILHACQQRHWTTKIPVERRLIEVIRDQLIAAPSVPVRLPALRDPRAQRVADLLLKSPGREETLGVLCKGTGGSTRTIERLFLKDTAMTFGKWRRQLRLLHAITLLGNEQKVSSAALDAGYSSASAFISMFKRATGITPKRFLSRRS